ncbi:hypothetical protein [Desulfovibrio inopinatus]|uniref:hypothetical protein n=1 Tax=Desulfovibrio inopinatus TaxID=102109 RepID=UPI0004192D30|nr:hypothetical protein [Desulfovibrio inopinatus]
MFDDSSRKYSILCIEDLDDDYSLVKRSFNGANYKGILDRSKSYDDARIKIKNDYNLIILDLQIGTVERGRDLFETIIKTALTQSKIPSIIVYSFYNGFELDFLRDGVWDYVDKHISLQRFVRLVHHHLSLRENHNLLRTSAKELLFEMMEDKIKIISKESSSNFKHFFLIKSHSDVLFFDNQLNPMRVSIPQEQLLRNDRLPDYGVPTVIHRPLSRLFDGIGEYFSNVDLYSALITRIRSSFSVPFYYCCCFTNGEEALSRLENIILLTYTTSVISKYLQGIEQKLLSLKEYEDGCTGFRES